MTSAEVRQRLEKFLKEHDRPGRITGYRLRELRAVELLETIGTSEAQTILTSLTGSDTPLAAIAAAAARRLKSR